MPNRLTVHVKITTKPGGLTIEPSDPVLHVPPQSNAPIFWDVAAGSADGARITNITFPWPAPPVPGYNFTPWPGDAPAQQPDGRWKVNNQNDNQGSASVYYKYNIYASVGTTPDKLDPIVDNQPPPVPKGGKGPKPKKS